MRQNVARAGGSLQDQKNTKSTSMWRNLMLQSLEKKFQQIEAVLVEAGQKTQSAEQKGAKSSRERNGKVMDLISERTCTRNVDCTIPRRTRPN